MTRIGNLLKDGEEVKRKYGKYFYYLDFRDGTETNLSCLRREWVQSGRRREVNSITKGGGEVWGKEVDSINEEVVLKALHMGYSKREAKLKREKKNRNFPLYAH